MPTPIAPGGMAVADLGLGRDLQDQVGAETAEQRKRRMLQMQQQGFMPSGTQQQGSPATLALFGGLGAVGK